MNVIYFFSGWVERGSLYRVPLKHHISRNDCWLHAIGESRNETVKRPSVSCSGSYLWVAILWVLADRCVLLQTHHLLEKKLNQLPTFYSFWTLHSWGKPGTNYSYKVTVYPSNLAATDTMCDCVCMHVYVYVYVYVNTPAHCVVVVLLQGPWWVSLSPTMHSSVVHQMLPMPTTLNSPLP